MSADTIFALSSGQPPAGIGIIRISGPAAATTLRAVVGRIPAPRVATYVTMADPADGDVIDRGLALWFPGPKTATGEDLAELHCHGGRAVTAALLLMLARQAGCRLAEPGEFARRAFLNGRIDLNEAQGLSDLLLAETQTQRRAAMAMAQGDFSRRLETWRSEIVRLAALAESVLDFSDADDVPDDGMELVIAEGLRALGEQVRHELSRPAAERLRDGIRVVIAGPPNAGKSTLLNRLVGREAAIISSIAGTTRDRIEVPVAIDGIAYVFTDTAGLRNDTDDRIEQTGIDRAHEAIEAADILLWLGEPQAAPRPDSLCIAAQSDRKDWTMAEGGQLALSAVSGAGLDALLDAIGQRASALLPRDDGYALHRQQREALEHIATLIAEARDQSDTLVVAEILRLLRGAIDQLTGKAGTEDMLDALFGTFCIGK
ncbi:tRNA uridine-5-carboxymethylaminomethyl(34) synthesis GTPase MnmE [Sphingobium algorifonticola]|uniref:tRNA modification GTPase MnmE n=1 Tax=Sphingobium algorifonticola TaxID=2008318 RepID=A0A437JD73_9SPHN|nr:tRNA uridine-5-carboxymethylaminomethyl(34) synthesis GTPase MnmE [Sphingobium algorifonticola]RVT43841.1 tRNA uridine-5-carboxymethylaminomethyl(34) synthesis GTPase MnmE [Sphingobium algorifonticola]